MARTPAGIIDQALLNLQRVSNYLKNGMETTTETAVDLLDFNKDLPEDCLDSLKDIMLQFVTLEKDMEQFTSSAQAVKAPALTGDMTMNVETMLNEKFQELKDSDEAGPLTDHQLYKDLLLKIQDIRDLEMEDEVASQAESGTTGSTAEDDVVFTQQELQTKCPFLMTEMLHPVKNRICGHHYEREGAEKIIKANRHIKCPVLGCINLKPLLMADMEDDLELKRKIEKKNRQAGKKITIGGKRNRDDINLNC